MISKRRKHKWNKGIFFENIITSIIAAFLTWGAAGYIKVLFTNLP